ncbi:MAG: aldehyde dehydrogenase family protein, partial [Myxococcota bacterium]|nr:aldehyde dehydrogenase family protein [Myxococcota bacterium]
MRYNVQAHINGEWISTNETTNNINPANTEEILGSSPMLSKADTLKAIDAAEKAYPAWRATPAPKRADILYKVLKLMDERREELAQAL